ncbi:MAG: hypothetical protein A3D35_00220 [Candidatus Staskawiczbacteria bacterium RIFCSPHIGHO2_02_FULL_34_9]|uniref:HD/PDEase domain-containing protein n=1 Tax=Candidatus Staskawiczbacteria bacterium RIFCSPHIGHO2_02_FULL_34_9 TaxID=1802206 RepID=A0A1G2I4C2_9BACT|nr:MAG: hypothetical protein A3D35_00220 [Candidatus Staskawiczbacteria bacterium RIFCSPHIGHO2_02_FULL_34_9]
MKSVREYFPSFYEEISKAHEGIHDGHDIYHVQRVAIWARRIALDEWNDEHIAGLAEIAAYCHNADRLKEKIYGRDNTPDNATEGLVRSWLCHVLTISTQDEITILRAVLDHNKPNDDADSKVTIALKDADRVVNLELDIIIRSGQFRPEIPAVDYELFLSDPKADYMNPKSCLRNVHYCLEWADPKKPKFCCRTKFGMKQAIERAAEIVWYESTLRSQLKKSGLLTA